MLTADGHRHPMNGEFIEVVENKTLVFRSTKPGTGNEPLVEVLNTVTFTPKGNKTLLTLHALVVHAAPEAKPILDGMHAGWDSSLDKLQNFIADQLNQSKFHI